VSPLNATCGKPQGTLVSDLTSGVITETTSPLEGSPFLCKVNPSHLAGSSLSLSSDHPKDTVPTRNIGGRPKGAANKAKEHRKNGNWKHQMMQQ
jgi:hypothetical protein